MRQHAAPGAERSRTSDIIRAAAASLLLLFVVVGAGPSGAQAGSSTAVQGARDSRSPGEFTLANSFSPTVAGTVSGLRYWSAGGSDGASEGTIRADDRTLLGRAFSQPGHQRAGWRIVTFETPVAVEAAHRYVIAVTSGRTGGVADLPPSGERAAVDSSFHWPADYAPSTPAPLWAGRPDRVHVIFTPGPAFAPTATPTPTPTADPSLAPAPNSTATPPQQAAGVPTRTTGPTAKAKSTSAPPPAPAAGGWPTAANTGVPAGTTLTPSGPLTITAAGTVVDGLLVNGSITVRANNVTIKNTKVVGGVIDNGNGDVAGTLIQDVEIDGGSGNGVGFLAGISYSGFTVVRANIHNVGVGVHANSNVVMKDSYVHDVVVEGDPANGGSHNEAFLSNGGTNLTVTNNRLSSGDQPNVSSALSLYGDFAPISNVLVQGNLFNGGGYCVYGGSVPGKPYPIATSTRFIGNTFGREMSPDCGGYGPAIDFSPGGGNVWTGNVWSDGGTVNP